jgi:hypothetical protein
MVSYRDELAQAIDWEPAKFIPDMAAFARAWEADGRRWRCYAPNDFDSFTKAHPVPMQVIARDKKSDPPAGPRRRQEALNAP